MLLVEECSASSLPSFQRVDTLLEGPANPDSSETKLDKMRLDRLRLAIRRNQVSFPSQVPTFPKRDRHDLQQKAVQLYFVFGWSGEKIGARYGLSALRIQQILNTWKKRAVEIGYVQAVPLAECLPRSSKDAPIRAVFCQVTSGSPAAEDQFPLPAGSPRLADQQLSDRTCPLKGFRPRTRFSVAQVAGTLKQLEAGRTAADVASDLGVSTCTVHAWKRQHERHWLRRENIQLKDQLAKLGQAQAKLIDLITRSDKAEDRAFMPFLRVSPHTDPDCCESL